MSRKLWIIVISVVLLGLLVIAAGAAALILIPHYRSQSNLAKARDYAADGELMVSRRHYEEYLNEKPSDLEAMEEYIDVCESFTTDRRRALLVAGRAYTRLAQREPGNVARKEQVIDFYRTNRFWFELEDAIKLFYGSDRTQLDNDLAYDRAVAIHMQGRNQVAEEELAAYLGLTGERQGAPLRDAPLRLARVYAEQGENLQIEPMFEELARRYPDDGMLPLNIAGYRLDQERADEAAEELDRVPDDVRGTMDYLLAASRLKTEQGDFEAALDLARKALDTDPESVDANLGYTLALERHGEREAAVAHLSNLDPMFRLDTPGFMMLLIEMKLEAGDLDGADTVRQTYADAYPDQRFLNEYLKGRIAFGRGADGSGSYDEARSYFVRAVEMNPALDRARYFLALTEFELDNSAGARIALDKYLDDNPEDERARRLWNAHFGQKESVIQLRYNARQLLKEASPDVDTLLYTAQEILSHNLEEDSSLARQLLEKAVQVEPARAQVYNALAAFYLDQEAYDAAEEVLEAASQNNLSDADFPLLKSNILLSRGDTREALSIARQALADASLATVETWSAFFARAGHLSEADGLLERYLDAGGEAAADAFDYRISLAIRFGSLDTAIALLEQAEARLADKPDDARVLNNMRIDAVRALTAQTPVNREAVDSILQRVEESDPDSEALALARGRLALSREVPDYSAAADAANAVPVDSTSYEEAQLLLAEIEYRLGRYDNVIDLAQGVLDITPRNATALYFIGEAQFGLRRLEESRETMEQLLKIDTTNLGAMAKLVQIYAELDLDQRAREMLLRYEENASRGSGGPRAVDELRAYLARDAGEHSDSEETLRRQLAEDPDNFGAMSGLVQSLVALGRTDEAIQTVESFLENNDESAEAWVLLGQAILERGSEADLTKASTAFTQAQLLAPTHSLALLGQIDVRIRMNEIGNAVTMCRRYLEKRPNDADVLFRLASLLSRNPDSFAEALALVDRAIALGNRPEFLRLRAFLYTRLDRHQEAVADMERLSALTQVTADDELTLAEAYLGLPDLEKARRSLDAAEARITAGDARLEARAQNVAAQIAATEATP